MEYITSRQNPLMGHLRKLNTSRAYRRQCGEYPCEGPKLLAEALRWGATVNTVVTTNGTGLPPLPDHVRVVSVPTEVLKSIADTETPQGLLFTCQLPDLTPSDKLPGGRLLVLDGVQDPGNVGTVWRTADAMGLDGVVLLPGCADAYAPKTVRATMGACFRLPVFETDLPTFSAILQKNEIPLFATALREDTVDLRAQCLDRCAVVIGSEGKGVSDETLLACERTIKIPMTGRCESLNAAVAATIIAWEMAKNNF